MKVCHITSAHRSDDSRIFEKECCSLAAMGYEVYLVASGASREEKGVHVIGVGSPPETKKERMTQFTMLVAEKALSLDCEIYHLHDPELLRVVSLLVKHGKKVIFDSHEDYKSLMLAKEWIPKSLRPIVSYVYSKYEKRVCNNLDGYIACYHWTKERVEKWISNCELVFNYPDWRPIDNSITSKENAKAFCYAGGLGQQWMHHNIIKR